MRDNRLIVFVVDIHNDIVKNNSIWNTFNLSFVINSERDANLLFGDKVKFYICNKIT